MSKNLSQTLYYEYYKTDPDFIFESVEEYRSYKSDPNFKYKSIEEYRRSKALLAKEIPITQESEEILYSEESNDDSVEIGSELENGMENISTFVEEEVETENENEEAVDPDDQSEIQIETESDMEFQIKSEIAELEKECAKQEEFELSLEQFWSNDEDEKMRSISEIEVNKKVNKKKSKSKFKIPKSRSVSNFSNVKSRYMDVFRKPKSVQSADLLCNISELTL